MIAYIWTVQPYENPSTNRRELINELIVFVAAYPLFVFTGDVYNEELCIQVGWFIIACILLNVMLNMIFLICHAVVIVYCKIKYCYIRSVKRKKYIAEQKYRIEEAKRLKEQEIKKNVDREKYIMSLFEKPKDSQCSIEQIESKKVDVKDQNNLIGVDKD